MFKENKCNINMIRSLFLIGAMLMFMSVPISACAQEGSWELVTKDDDENTYYIEGGTDGEEIELDKITNKYLLFDEMDLNNSYGKTLIINEGQTLKYSGSMDTLASIKNYGKIYSDDTLNEFNPSIQIGTEGMSATLENYGTIECNELRICDSKLINKNIINCTIFKLTVYDADQCATSVNNDGLINVSDSIKLLIAQNSDKIDSVTNNIVGNGYIVVDDFKLYNDEHTGIVTASNYTGRQWITRDYYDKNESEILKKLFPDKYSGDSQDDDSNDSSDSNDDNSSSSDSDSSSDNDSDSEQEVEAEDTNQPKVGDSLGWKSFETEMNSALEDAKLSGLQAVLNVSMTNDNYIPADIIKALANSDIVLSATINNSVIITLDGSNLSGINESFTKIEMLPYGDTKMIKINTANTDLTKTINLFEQIGTDKVGSSTALYVLDSNETPVLFKTGIVYENGYAAFETPFVHARYVITVD
jgi:hypothetical protein